MTKIPSVCLPSKLHDHILVNRPNRRCHNCGKEKDLGCEQCNGLSFYEDDLP